MEHFDVVEKHELCLTFKSKDTGHTINLSKKWLKNHFDGNVEDIMSMDNTDDGNLIFNTLH